MKKAKIFLTALTVLTVAGGALAFKVKTQSTFYTCNLTLKKCVIPVTTTFETTTTPDVGEFRTYDIFNAPCNDGINECSTFVTASL
jgi:hypothetical protein